MQAIKAVRGAGRTIPLPLSGDWREIVGDDAVAILAQLLMAAEKGYPSVDLRQSRCRCLRELPLPFYPGYRLIDAQFHWPDQQLPRLCSGIIGPKGVLLLDGKSDRLHTINPYLLSFNATHAVETYLGFFCALVRGDEGPFQVISEVGEIPVGDSPEESLLKGVTSRARGSRWARSEMTRAVGTLPGWPGRG